MRPERQTENGHEMHVGGGGSVYSKKGARRQLPKSTRLPDMTLDLVRLKGCVERGIGRRKKKHVLICLKNVLNSSHCLVLSRSNQKDKLLFIEGAKTLVTGLGIIRQVCDCNKNTQTHTPFVSPNIIKDNVRPSTDKQNVSRGTQITLSL